MKNELLTFKCAGKNTRPLTVAAASEKEARRSYRSFFPKNRIKDIVAVDLVAEEKAAIKGAMAGLNAGCGV
jgi:hypothetical protein